MGAAALYVLITLASGPLALRGLSRVARLTLNALAQVLAKRGLPDRTAAGELVGPLEPGARPLPPEGFGVAYLADVEQRYAALLARASAAGIEVGHCGGSACAAMIGVEGGASAAPAGKRCGCKCEGCFAERTLVEHAHRMTWAQAAKLVSDR